MAWWIYLGKITTPVSGGVSAVINEKGSKPVVAEKDPSVPTVLVPRLKFEAPMSSVHHLLRLKKVAPLKPHQIPKEPKPEEKEPTAKVIEPVVEPKSVYESPEEPKEKERLSYEEMHVVASDTDENINIEEEIEELF